MWDVVRAWLGFRNRCARLGCGGGHHRRRKPRRSGHTGGDDPSSTPDTTVNEVEMGTYLIQNGTLLDATGGATRPRTSVYVKDKRITKIGPADDLKRYPAGAGPHKTI